jgi:fatty acid/phospholipid biosynthesis enzyme
MTIVQTQTTSFKAELYQGIHDLDTDVLKIALYTANADLNEATTAYSASNEITGTGYTATGQVITNVVISSENSTAYVSFDNPYWNPASFTTRCALIYNVTKANRSICVLDFGADKTCTNTFLITLPANTVNSALIRSSN